MLGRREFAVTGLSALGLAALQGSANAQAKPAAGADPHAGHATGMMACAQACSDCQRECDSCFSHCTHLLEQGHKEHVATLMTCRDCAAICATASQIVAGSGPFSENICESCAKACAECAKACDKFPDDAHMKKCADECRKCEKACRAMIGHASGK